MQKINLTGEQMDVASAMLDYVRTGTEPYIAVSGYAGTGKTTVMGYAGSKIVEMNPKIAIAWCAPTGKAASVLKNKLADFGALNSNSEVNTVHGHIYRLNKSNSREGKLSFSRKSSELFDYDLIVVDEASMITRDMFSDLLAFGKKIIFIGDSGQLPPVGDVAFAPLINTNLNLSTVHRQALKNPITAVATEVRNGGGIPYGARGHEFCKIHKGSSQFQRIIKMFADKILGGETMILCGINATRIQLNRSLRAMLGFTGTLPMAGEKLVCLKNRRDFGLFNGQIVNVCEAAQYMDNTACYMVGLENDVAVMAYTGALNTPPGPALRDRMNADWENIKECKDEMGDDPFLFDYGYACSVHKAQGSEWENVLLYDERTRHMDDMDYARWLYTGITRARNRLCILC